MLAPEPTATAPLTVPFPCKLCPLLKVNALDDTSNVVLGVTVMFVEPVSNAPAANATVPPLIVVAPVNVLVPANVSVPVFIFIRLPMPVNPPAKVLLELLPPMLNATGLPTVSTSACDEMPDKAATLKGPVFTPAANDTGLLFVDVMFTHAFASAFR